MSHQPVADSDLVGTLCRLFYGAPEELAHFERVPAEAIPKDYRDLLGHEEHMTEAVERWYGEKVDLKVVEAETTATHYARQILLLRGGDGKVVQFGIMRIALGQLDDSLRREVERRQRPLGRILIAHDVLRKVQLVSLYRVTPDGRLGELLSVEAGQVTYGRTARIYVGREPAVELLEIVRPLPGPL